MSTQKLQLDLASIETTTDLWSWMDDACPAMKSFAIAEMVGWVGPNRALTHPSIDILYGMTKPKVIPTNLFVSHWYDVICALPSAKGCDYDLVVKAEPWDQDGLLMFGEFNDENQTVTIALEPNPYSVIGTILHEVGHFAANPRHNRPHGYSWRRAFRDITEEFLEIDPAHEAKRVREEWLSETGRHHPHSDALDVAVTRLIKQCKVYDIK